MTILNFQRILIVMIKRKNTSSVIIMLAVLLMLLPLSGEAQSITRNKKQQMTTTTKSKQGSSNSNSGKPKKKTKTSMQLSSRRSSSSTQSNMPSQSSSPIIPAVVRQAIDDMVWVEGGSFMMGSIEKKEADAYCENPAHEVTLSDYYIGKYEVTQELWQAVMGSNPSKFKGDCHLPVENVSWYDCQEFLRKLNTLTNNRFRLPTEAEWEFAARGGNLSLGYRYAGDKDLSRVAWYAVNFVCGDRGDATHVIGTKLPNELGLYDMSGNVWEWCADWFGQYGKGSQTNPTGWYCGNNRVNRGGAWNQPSWRCFVYSRNNAAPGDARSDLGLRLALSSL